MKRALLVFNPEATSVSARVRDVIARALASEVTLDVTETKRRHHATHLAQGAAHEGADLVVVLGGDGTLNEVVNGLAGTDVPVAPLPGGGTNVFARTLGYPKDPIEATAVLIERLRAPDSVRRVNLARVNGRLFAFCAGIGFDAAVVRAVERRVKMKKHIGEAYFVGSAVRIALFGYRRRPMPITVVAGDSTVEHLRSVFVCNSDPYTFWGDRPLRLCPRADLDRALEVTAVTTLSIPRALRILWRAFGSGKHIKLKYVRAFHDLERLDVRTDRLLPYQVDGEYAGEADTFLFENVPKALSVIA